MATYTTFSAQQLFMIIFVTFVFSSEPGKARAFSIDLYHRDSYGSPFYNSSLSKSDIIRRAIARSVKRCSMVTPDSPKAKLICYRAEYLMHIRLGTPPVDIFALVDTGSDFTWIQCEPCIRCVPQMTPLFNPQSSSSYARVHCGPNKPCPPKPMSRCQADGFCHYDAHYGDGSYSKGLLSMETMRMESTIAGDIVEIPDYIFGCGTDNDVKSGSFIPAVIGLGAGPHSLVTQLRSHSSQGFSYCLIPLGSKEKVSHIRFGPSANVHGPGTITVPLVNKHSSNLYFVTLEAFTIGGERIDFTGLSGMVEEGNIVIDSGTAMSRLPVQFYTQIKNVVTRQASAPPVPDPLETFDLCFKKDKLLQLPSIVANFRGGDVPLKQHNAFVSLEKIECLAFSVVDKVVVYGSVAQQDFIVGYDIIRGTVSFKPFKCTNF